MGLSRAIRSVLIAVLVLVFVLALGVTVSLNVERSKFEVLFPNITQEESREIYAALQEMGSTPQMNAKGQVMVPKEQWDNLVFDLAGKGYPKTAPAYGIFLDNTGFTRTEYEKRQVLLFQTQNRIQETLSRIDGINSAIVTITVAEESALVWDENRQLDSKASVMVKMDENVKLSPERVAAIKNLTAYSVPKLSIDKVKVIDGATGIELDTGEDAAASGYDAKRLEYERQIEQDIVNKVKELLSPKYGPDGVTAVATVKLDYRQMRSEEKTLVPKDDGTGYTTRNEERYALSGNVPADGLVGEENNTDVPQYNSGEGGDGAMTDYERITDYDFGYLLTQIDKGQADIVEKSVSVLVNDTNFDTETRDSLMDLVSKGTNIDPTYISITNLDLGVQPEPEATPEPEVAGASNRTLILIIVGAGVFVLLIVFLVLYLVSQHKKKIQRQLEEVALAEQLAKEAELKKMQDEISEHKRNLALSAQAGANPMESAISDEIKQFTKQNPEIAAGLIRTWLREDE